MEYRLYITSLYDIYNSLLTEKQKTYFEEYYFNNLTLSELSENYGISRNGIYKQIRNILIVWLLTGIWHGANWTFLIWGLLFGIILIIEKLWLNKFMEKLPSFIRRIYVLFIVMILFISKID